MPDPASILIVLLILLFSFTLSTATGFGAAVVSIPLCSFFIDVKLVIPLLALTSLTNCLYLTTREHSQVDWPELRRILLWGGIAFPLGNAGYHYLPMTWLEYLLGIFVTVVALHGLWKLYHRHPHTPWNTAAGRILLLAGGLIHGALASGGPLIVTYAQQSLPEKRRFRATLLIVWIIFNSLFMASYFSGPSRQTAVLLMGLLCLPSLAVGVWLGQKLHHRASDRFFQGLVSTTLLVSGVSLLVR